MTTINIIKQEIPSNRRTQFNELYKALAETAALLCIHLCNGNHCQACKSAHVALCQAEETLLEWELGE